MEADFFMTQRVLNTLKSLEVIANHLANVPGRKNLIWVSGGFPLTIGFDEIPKIDSPIREHRMFTQEMDHAIRAVNNANIAIYPVDARGLVVPPQFSAAASGPPITAPRLKPLVPYLDTMAELADRTGGRASYNNNDLKNAIRRAMDDSKVTYTLGYYPLSSDPDGKFRDIKVKVNRPGANVRSRKGYFAMRDAPQDEKTRKAEIIGAVWSPLDATAVSVNARVDFVDKPQPNSMSVFTQIDPMSLSLTKKESRWVGSIDVFFVQKDEQGHQFNGVSDTITLNLTDATYKEALQKGFIYRKIFPKAPKATNLRIVVRDTPSGSVGSLTIPFKSIEGV
jgi:hypothetical protein